MKYCVILFCLAIGTLFGQTTYTGTVLSENGELLQLANVTVEGTKEGATTDTDGSFQIKGQFESSTKLIISYIGFETAKVYLADFEGTDYTQIYLKKKIFSSQTVLVKGSIGQEGSSPISFAKLHKEDIEDNYSVQDVPEMLSYLPSTTFYSESGTGIGYNYVSVRGFDQRRISISINGIPQNDPEDHNVYWLDFPDLLGSAEMIQVQRGAGSGVIGYPAVGGSINIITSPFSDKPRMEVGTTYGSYNTRKYSAAFSSGLINNKYSVYARVSHLMSNGYRDKSWVDFKSYHLSAVRYDENVTTQINIFGGPISDGLAYTGIPKFYNGSQKDRKKNYNYWEADSGKVDYASSRRKDEKEGFSQPHYELLNEIKLSDDITFNSALFLVIGKGYFDFDGSWADSNYLRLTAKNGFEAEGNPGNALIRAQVENKQWGWIPRISLKHYNGELIVGGELRYHNSYHWGGINHAENLPAGVTKDFHYYEYKGSKDIINAYVNENYSVNERLNLLAEFQVAYHKYRIYDEKYVGTDFSVDDIFFNPRIGVNYKFTPNVSSYISFARVTREPRLKNYYDAAESSGGEVPQFEVMKNGEYDFDKPLVSPETMNNIELGTTYNDENLFLSLNGFYMIFEDEIVKQGQVDRFGQPVTGNMDETIHAGLELSAKVKFTDFFDVTVNGTYSENYISKGTYAIDSEKSIDLEGNRISGFPNTMFNAIFDFHYEGLKLQISNKYVGEFYSDNYDNKLKEYIASYPGEFEYDDNVIESYFVTNLFASVKFGLSPIFNEVSIFAQVNNLFNNNYLAHGEGKDFFPAARRNFLTGIKVNL